LREDLLEEVGKLAREGRFDHLVIESTGISEPMPVAETFTFTDEAGSSLSDIANIDAMVTVVDARNFLNDYSGVEQLKERGEVAGEEDERTIVDLLTDQIEFANIILINKTDLISEEEGKHIHGMIRALNPKAVIHETVNSGIEIDKILGTNLYDLEDAESTPGWLDSLVEYTPETEEYGIGNFIYASRIPFHPKRLYEVFNSEWPGVIRSKGVFWLATRLAYAGFWSQAGAVASHRCAGYFWASIPRDHWPEDKSEIEHNWQEPNGDCRQEIVLIGQNMDELALRAMLDGALLTPEEMASDKEQWGALFEDPFPNWEMRAVV